MMHQKIITQIRVSFSLNQHFLKWPQIPISAIECYIFSLSSWLTIQLLGINTLITFPYNYFLSFKLINPIYAFLIFYFQYILDTLRVDTTEGFYNKLENSLYQTIFLHLLTNFFFGMYTLIQTLNLKTNNPNQKVPN